MKFKNNIFIHVITLSILFTGMPLFASILKPDVKADLKPDLKPGIHEKILDNDLKILVKKDNRAPIVVFQIWYKIGSSFERSGKTGVSHVLEHMMFKGTEKYPGDSFNEIIALNGGEDNAFTSRDYTAYYQKLEKSRLEVSFQLEADRMKNLTFSSDDFNKEVMVVQEERRWRTDDKPQSRAYEQLFVSAFENTGYHHPIIGWMNDLENLTENDVKGWYQRYYSPNNATIVVVGDIDVDEVFTLAEKYFADIPKADLGVKKNLIERPQLGYKQVDLQLKAKVPYLIMGYKTPTLNTLTEENQWEAYALELLSGILDGGDSTRFPAKLVKEKQIAASASTSYSSYARMKTLFVIDAVPAKNKTLQQLITAIDREIELIKTDVVSEKELQRIKNQIVSSEVYEKDSVFYQAMKLGSAEINGVGWRKDLNFVKNINKITPQQVQQVAQKYLNKNLLTLVKVIPQDNNTQTAQLLENK